MRRALSAFAFVLLLFAQQAALTHAAWHVGEDLAVAHHDGKEKKSFQGSLCDLHGLFNQVLGGAKGAALSVVPQDIPAVRFEEPAPPYHRAPRLALRCRDPPRVS